MVYFIFTSMAAYALPLWSRDASSELTGSRTSPSKSGVDAIGTWNNGGFIFSWEITFDDITSLYTYEYTIEMDDPGISNFILEFTEDDAPFIISDGSDEIGDDEPKKWTETGNIRLPNPIYGGKFDFEADYDITYTVVTDRKPVYGVFAAKGGGDSAGSNAKNYSDHQTNEGLATTDFIIRPHGPLQGNSDPATMILLGFGMIGLAGLGRKRLLKKK